MTEGQSDNPQVERDAKARREIARASGIALIGMSAALEEGLVVVPGAGAVTFALVAFAARGRRLLRSAYRLIDAGERDGAVPLYRVMNEYLIVGRWLLKLGEDELKVWALDDLRGRLVLLRDVADDRKLDAEIRTTLGEEVVRTEEAIRGYGGAHEPITKRGAKKAGYEVPSLEAMAAIGGLDFVYAYPYRVASQTDVHATPAAVDAAYEVDEHGHAVRAVPRFALEGYDSYLVGAHLLLDLLRPLVDQIPELEWNRTTAFVDETLAGIARADPETNSGSASRG